MRRHYYLLLIAAICCLASCEKAEEAIVLPKPGSATSASIVLGKEYDKQVFFDFGTGQTVATDPKSWDLAFESSTDGRHVFMNGGQGVFVYNMHQSDMQVKTLPSAITATGISGWQFDDPKGLPEGTGMGDWWQSNGSTKGEVYIIKLNSGLQKLRILSADESGYTIEWMPFYSTGTPTQVQIKKDTTVSYVYFSFSKGITTPEPPKTSWDIVFTHYRELVYDNAVGYAVPYQVTGALLNPHNTLAAADSSDNFSSIDLDKAQKLVLSKARNTIGYDWKTVALNGGSATYTVNPHKCYVVRTMEGYLYKMHFLGFYDSNGNKGNPFFEYERLK